MQNANAYAGVLLHTVCLYRIIRYNGVKINHGRNNRRDLQTG